MVNYEKEAIVAFDDGREFNDKTSLKRYNDDIVSVNEIIPLRDINYVVIVMREKELV